MNKSTNKHRHKWVEPFDAPFTCSPSGRKHAKRSINKFRRRQLKSEVVTGHNRFGGYWA